MSSLRDSGDLRDTPVLSWAENLGSFQTFLATDKENGASGSVVPTYCDSARTVIPKTLGTGHWDFVRFSSSFGMLVNHAIYYEPQVMRFLGEGLLKFHFRLSAKTKLVIEDGDEYDLGPSVFQIFYHAIGFNDCEWIYESPAGWVTIYCDPIFLVDELGFDKDSLPRDLSACVYGERLSPYVMNAPMQRDMTSSVQAIVAEARPNRARKQYLRAKCIELIYLAIMWSKSATADDDLRYRFSKRDLTALDRARLLICEEVESLLRVKDVCDSVGINRNKLTMGFRHLYGKTPYEFILEKRMEEAQRRLIQSNDSVEEISYALGYDHPNNFSTAFTREIGLSPSSFRKIHCPRGRGS
jgi:AraC-like DNA-binding protein